MTRNPEREAGKLLEFAWSGRGVPVDPVLIARELGVRVMLADLKPSVSGALVKQVDHVPVIFVNKSDPYNRQRFTCAHELGHYVDRFRGSSSESDLSQYNFVDYRGGSGSTVDREAERFADQFAAALLMPEAEIRDAFSKFPSGEDREFYVFVLAKQFGVSNEAMSIRLSTLGLLRRSLAETA